MTEASFLQCYLEKDEKIGQDSIILSYNALKKDLEVRISPYYGSNIYAFKYNGKDIFYCDYNLLKDRDWTGCFVLWPFPNRVRDKKFEFEGTSYSLEGIKRKKGNYPLIHGLVDDQIWHVGELQEEEDAVKASSYIEIKPGSPLHKYFPFESKLTLTFTLSGQGLKIEYTVENKSKKNMPFGFALHPYFSLLSGRNKTYVQLTADSVMEADEELLPTGRLIDIEKTNFNLKSPLPVSQLSLDHVFTDLNPHQSSFVNYSNQKMKIYLESSEDFTHMVLYTMEKPFICFENQTGSTDMINLYNKGLKENDLTLQKAAHLLVLPPSSKHRGSILYRIEVQS